MEYQVQPIGYVEAATQTNTGRTALVLALLVLGKAGLEAAADGRLDPGEVAHLVEIVCGWFGAISLRRSNGRITSKSVLVALVVLASAGTLAPAAALDHFVVGLEPSAQVRVTGPEGFDAETTSTESGAVTFVGTGPGPYSVATLQIGGCPNLQIASIETAPTAPACGDTVRVRGLVRNVGQAATPTASLTRISLDGALKFMAPTPVIPAGGEAWTAWVSLGAPAQGPHQVEVCADATNLVREESETDNCR